MASFLNNKNISKNTKKLQKKNYIHSAPFVAYFWAYIPPFSFLLYTPAWRWYPVLRKLYIFISICYFPARNINKFLFHFVRFAKKFQHSHFLFNINGRHIQNMRTVCKRVLLIYVHILDQVNTILRCELKFRCHKKLPFAFSWEIVGVNWNKHPV